MSLATTRELVEGARERGAALVAFNVVGLEHVEAVADGAALARQPAIMQISANAVAFRGALEPLAAACRATAEAADVPLALHLDHATDLELCRAAAAAGFSSVMFDAAAADEATNLRETGAAAAWAHEHGLWLEGELGEIAGKPGARAGEATDPEQARAFAEATGVDLLAVAVGSRHKMRDRSATLDLERIRALRAAVPVPLVLHGSSGVADEHLRVAVHAGMTKINVGTRLGDAFTTAVRRRLETPGALDPRELLRPARDAMRAEVATLLRALDAGGA